MRTREFQTQTRQNVTFGKACPSSYSQCLLDCFAVLMHVQHNAGGQHSKLAACLAFFPERLL